MAEVVLQTRALTKRFGEVAAVQELDLSIERGEVVGLLGPNGAGKTTTLRVLLGLARPTSGEVTVLGGPAGAPHVLAEVGAVVEEPALYPYLSGRDHLRVLARYTGASAARIEAALAQVELTGAAEQKTKAYSMGMRQRLAIAGALLKDPRLLVLDEPTNGLDPAGITAMRGWLRDFAGDGRTVLLSSHLLGEVEQICDRVVVLRQGRKVADVAVKDLSTDAPMIFLVDHVDRAVDILRQVPDVGAIEPGEGHVQAVLPPETAGAVNTALVRAGIEVSGLWPVHRSLEDMFFALTSDSSEATGTRADSSEVAAAADGA